MNLERLDERRVVAIGALMLYGVLSVVSLVVDIHRLTVVDDILAVVRDPFHSEQSALSVLSAAQSSDNTTHLIGWLTLAAWVTCAVTFIRWSRTAYDNTLSFGATPRYSSGWVTGAWFVPVVNLVRPKQIIDDIWHGSGHEPAAPSGGVPGALNWWWGTWVLAGVLGGLTRIDSGNDVGSFATLTGHLRTTTHLDMASDVCTVIAAVLAIRMLGLITARQHQRAQVVPAFAPATMAVTPLAAAGSAARPFPADPFAPPVAGPSSAPTLWQGWAPDPTPPRPEAPDTSGSVPPPGFPRR